MRTLKSAVSLALLLGVGAMATAVPAAGQAYIGVSADFAPPPLPYYDQPPIPGYGYIWTPGYWAWDPGYQDYYWIPGSWVLPPRVGYLWTPGYWGWDDGVYAFNAGYWGARIGYYGGIDYGFGYNGYGYYGGEWRGDRFYYNRVVNNVRNINEGAVYARSFPNANVHSRTSFNGGRGGVQIRPTPQQLAAGRAPRIGVTPQQQQHIQLARSQPAQRASFNHGAPPIAATARPAAFSGDGVVPARGANAFRAGPAAREFRNGVQPGAAYGGPRPGEPRGDFRYAPVNERAAPNRPAPAFERSNAERSGPRPQGEFARPEQGRAPQSFDRPGREGPGPRPQFDRPEPQARFARPEQARPPQAQFARPAPQEMRAPPQMRAAPQMPARPAPQPRPQPEARPGPAPAGHEEHPH